MAIINMAGIVAYYNLVIRSFMDNGYVISPFTMSGMSTNVYGYTDLIKPDDTRSIIRVFMCQNFVNTDGHRHPDGSFYYTCYKQVIVKAKIYTWDGTFSPKYLYPDVWGTISERIFCRLDDDNDDLYCDSEAEMLRILEIREQRVLRKCQSRYNQKKSYPINTLSADFIDQIMEKINSFYGFKRATASCIDKVCSYVNSSDKRFKGEVTFSLNRRSGTIHLK